MEISAASIDLTSLGGSVQAATSTANLRMAVIAIHALVLVTAWIFIIPCATIMASPIYRRKWFASDRSNPWGSRAHKTFMVFAVAFTIIGAALGWFVIGTHSQLPHFITGTLATILMFVQAFLGNWRSRIYPQHIRDPKMRRKRDALVNMHAWLGRIVWILAVVAIFFGLPIAGYTVGFYIAGYILAGLAAIPVFLGPLTALLQRRSDTEQASESDQVLDMSNASKSVA